MERGKIEAPRDMSILMTGTSNVALQATFWDLLGPSEIDFFPHLDHVSLERYLETLISYFHNFRPRIKNGEADVNPTDGSGHDFM